MMLLRISPSPDWFEDMEPLASTKPAMPLGVKVVAGSAGPTRSWRCRHRRHAELPATCRSRSRSPPQSETLKGGFARIKSARRSGWRSSWKLSP